MRLKPAGTRRESPLELVRRDGWSVNCQAGEHTLWASGRSSILLVSQGILHSLLLHEREELSFSQLGCLWPEYFNWALNFETVRQGKKFNIQLPHPNDTYETAGGDSKVTFEGKTFNCAFRRNYNHHCTLHGTP